MFRCENCGGELVYSIKEKKLKCMSCGSLFDIDNANDIEQAETIDMNVFTCPSCGGEIYSNSSTAASFCSFCGSHVTLTQKMVKWKKPEYVIPFEVTREKAKEIVANKIKKKLFVPNELKAKNNLDICRGIFIPYWVYETDGTLDFTLDGESISDNSHSVYRLTGKASGKFAGLNHDASDSFADDIGNNLNPYNLKDAEKFNSAYLCGFFADMADKDYTAYSSAIQESATELMQEETREYLKAKYQDLDTIDKPHGGNITIKDASLCLFPVWLVSYRNKDSVAYFAVNGTNGKVVTDTPVEQKKYFIASGILSVLFALLFFKLNSGTTHELLYPIGFFTILNVIGLVIGNKIMSRKGIHRPSNNYMLIIMVLMSVLGFILGARDIPDDIVYYGYALLEIIVNVGGLLSGIKYLNLITARELPQYKYKGKDK